MTVCIVLIEQHVHIALNVYELEMNFVQYVVEIDVQTPVMTSIVEMEMLILIDLIIFYEMLMMKNVMMVIQ